MYFWVNMPFNVSDEIQTTLNKLKEEEHDCKRAGPLSRDIRWMYHDGDRFLEYGSLINAKIEAAYSQKKCGVTITSEEEEDFQIDFSSMTNTDPLGDATLVQRMKENSTTQIIEHEAVTRFSRDNLRKLQSLEQIHDVSISVEKLAGRIVIRGLPSDILNVSGEIHTILHELKEEEHDCKRSGALSNSSMTMTDSHGDATLVQRMKENSTTQIIEHEAVTRFSRDNLRKLQSLEQIHDVSISVEKLAGRIVIRGLPSDILNVSGEIHTILHELKEEEHDCKRARALSKDIRWMCHDGDRFVEYGSLINAKIEAAYSQKKCGVTITSEEEEDFQIDFSSMTNTDPLGDATLVQRMKENSTTQIIEHEAVTRFSRDNLRKLQSLEQIHDVSISVEKLAGRIVIRGLPSDILNVSGEIHTILHELKEEEHDCKRARALSKDIRWMCHDGDRFVEYGSLINAKIEAAYSQKKCGVTITSEEEEDFQIDFSSMTMTDLHGDATPVERSDLRKGRTNKVWVQIERARKRLCIKAYI